jgi:hypothetical protein
VRCTEQGRDLTHHPLTSPCDPPEGEADLELARVAVVHVHNLDGVNQLISQQTNIKETKGEYHRKVDSTIRRTLDG